MKNKLYFSQGDDELCYELAYILSELRQESYDKIEVYEAIKDKDCGYKWCVEMGEPVERKDGNCGKECPYYAPKNGKNGCCKALHSCYTAGRKYILYKSGKLELIKEQ